MTHTHALRLSTSTTARAGRMMGTAVVNRRGEHPTEVSARGFSGTKDGGRAFLSMPPHHLARKNNGMVNGLVKSTKVPRPIVAMPPSTRSRNQLKESSLSRKKPMRKRGESGKVIFATSGTTACPSRRS